MRLFWLLFLLNFQIYSQTQCELLNSQITKMNEQKVIKSYAEIYRKCPEQALSIPCFLPLKDFVNTHISSGFGNRIHPIKGIIKHHNGIDIVSPIKEVIATASGIVLKTGYENGLGNFVIIDHQNSYQTTYGHLSTIAVSAGQKVMITEAIGLVGSTGASTGNHIHYEIRKNGVLVNPVGYLLLFYELNR